MIVNIKKRYAYFIIGLLVLAVGVFVVNALTPGVAPNPGHTIETVSPPTGCGDGQVLQFIDEASGWGCVGLPSDYYTKSETYSKEQIDAIISVLELGGTGCPVSYTYYEQSTETAKCYPDGEVIKLLDFYFTPDLTFTCEGRIVSGVLQSRTTCSDSYSTVANSGWVGSNSQVSCYGAIIRCAVNWNELSGSGPTGAFGPVSFGNILQIN